MEKGYFLENQNVTSHRGGGGLGGCPLQCHQMTHGEGGSKIGRKSVTYYLNGTLFLFSSNQSLIANKEFISIYRWLKVKSWDEIFWICLKWMCNNSTELNEINREHYRNLCDENKNWLLYCCFCPVIYFALNLVISKRGTPISGFPYYLLCFLPSISST